MTKQKSLHDFWIPYYKAERCVCQKCFIVAKYATEHNASGKPFYRRKYTIKGGINLVCRVCYEEYFK